MRGNASGNATWKRALLLALVCAVVALVASFDELHAALLRAVSAVGGLITERPVLGAAAFVLAAAASAMLAFFSSAVLVPVALYTWGKPACLLLLWAGWTLGGVTAYWLGRSLGRPVVGWFLPASTLARYEHRVSDLTPFPVVLLFQLALPSEVPGYVLGMARYRFWKYLASLMLAELPYAVGTIYLGANFLERRPVVFLAIGIAGALSTGLALAALHRRLQRGR